MERGQILNVDTTKSEIQNPLVKLRQGDGNYQTLRVTVRNSGEPINLDGWTITFMGTTAGNHKIVDSKVLIEDSSLGIFSYTPTKAWGQDIGEFNKAYFKFTKNDESASSATFRVNVLEAVDLTQEEAGNYISVVDTLIENVKNDMNAALSDTQSTLANAQSEAHSTSEAVSTYTSAASQAVSDVNSAASAATSSMGNQLEDFKTKDNTFTGKNTFTQLIEGSITGHAAVATTASDPDAVHKTDIGNIKLWQPNTNYKVNDLVYLTHINSTDITLGQIDGGIMRCLINHTSDSSLFPSSDSGIWELTNAESYKMTGSLTFGYGRNLTIHRVGNTLKMGYYASAGTQNKFGAGTTNLAEKLPSWANPDINGMDMTLYINSTDWPGTRIDWVLAIHNNANISSFSSFGDIASTAVLRGNGTTYTNAKPYWSGSAPSL